MQRFILPFVAALLAAVMVPLRSIMNGGNWLLDHLAPTRRQSVVATKVAGVVQFGFRDTRPSFGRASLFRSFALAGSAVAVMLLGSLAVVAVQSALLAKGHSATALAMNTSLQRIELAFSESNVVDTKIPRGTLFDHLIIDVPFTATVATDATAVRTRGAPIKYVQFIGDGGKIHLAAKLQDLIRIAEIYDKTSLAVILTSPSGVTAAGGPYTGRIKLPIPFSALYSNAPWMTALASWRLSKDPVLRIQWGSHAEIFRGGTGSVAVTAGQAFIQLASLDNFDTHGLSADDFGDLLGVNVESYQETTYTAANDRVKVEVPNTADIRSIMITGEDTNGDPLSETEMAKISFDLVENTINRIDAGVNLGTLRSMNSKQFKFVGTLPPGVAIKEFAADPNQDLGSQLYEATKKNKVELVFNVPAPASGTYTLRVHTRGVEPGRGARAA